MMSNQPTFRPDRNAEPKKGFGANLWRAITYNWAWKLISVILAICLWGGLISQDTTLLREKTINDVSVTVTNASTLQRNGLIVVDGLQNLNDVYIKVDVPQRYYNTVTDANYNVRVDLSTIKEAGTQTIPIIATNSTTYGNVTEISVSKITVTVESYISRSRIPVRVESAGTVPDGFYASTAAVDPGTISIAGPETLVNSISRCVALYNMSTLSAKQGTERTAVPFLLYDNAGNTVENSNITVTAEGIVLDSIIVEQTLYPAVKMGLSEVGIVTGTPAKGYEIVNVTYSPTEVEIAAKDLDAHTSDFVYLEGDVDVTGLTESVTKALTLSRPSGVIYMSTDIVYVTVEIAPNSVSEGAKGT